MKATVSPLFSNVAVVSTPFSPGVATSAVFQVSYSGGFGAPTYNWVMDSGALPKDFTNPVNSSNQRISVLVPTDHIVRHVFAHCVVTDSLGDVATSPTVDFAYVAS